MKGKVTSLNASVSTGIVVYEAVKQRIQYKQITKNKVYQNKGTFYSKSKH